VSARLPALLALPWWLAGCQTPPPPLPSHADIVRSELSQLVGVDEPTCGAVQVHSRQGRLDYRVECSSGQVFHVRVGADGRVRVTALAAP
jgi:hypothetical protein